MANTKFPFYKAAIAALILIPTLLLFTATRSDNDPRYFEISKNLEIFKNVYQEVSLKHAEEPDPSILMRTAVDAMLESLDPYTNFISEAEMENYKFLSNPRKVGTVAAKLYEHKGKILFTNIFEGLSVDKNGIKPGDELIGINGTDITGRPYSDVEKLLKGSIGSSVETKIKRANSTETESFSLVREQVMLPNVPYSGMIDEHTGYIVLTTFTQNAGANVANAFSKLQEKNDVKQLILDLRNNGGGLLNEAINLANVFIDKGVEVVTTKAKIGDWDRSYKTLNETVDRNIPLVILINESSASASEIVCGSIQDLDRGLLVGRKSFGKGLVQNTKDTPFNSKLKITVSKYYIPSGRCIQAKQYENGVPVNIPDSLKSTFKTKNGRIVLDGGGVEPDVEVIKPSKSSILKSLESNLLLFHFATDYYNKHKTIPPAKEFSLGEEDFENFKTFISNKEYSYKTASEKTLSKLEKKTKEEKYYAALKDKINSVKSKFKTSKQSDVVLHKTEILRTLEQEIVRRYYYEKGAIEVNLAHDEDVKVALKLFNDKERYERLLTAQ